MAIIEVPKSCSASLKLNKGTKPDGTVIVQGVNIPSIRFNSNSSAIYAVATALAPILAYPALRVEHMQTVTLEDDGD